MNRLGQIFGSCSLSLILIVFASNGCARVLTFKAVDAFTGKPIEGVDVSLVHGRKDVILSSYSVREHAGMTDANGMISIGPMNWGEFNHIYFHGVGYFRATAVWGPSQHSQVSVFTQAIDPVAAKGRRSVLQPSDKEVEVPMFRDTLPRIHIVIPGMRAQDIEKWGDGPED